MEDGAEGLGPDELDRWRDRPPLSWKKLHSYFSVAQLYMNLSIPLSLSHSPSVLPFSYTFTHRGSRSLQNLVAISRRYCQPLVILKAGCIGNNGKNWLLNPVTSS